VPTRLEALRKPRPAVRPHRTGRGGFAPRPYEIVVPVRPRGRPRGATFKQRNGYGLDELVERSPRARGGVTGISGGDEQHAMVQGPRSTRRPAHKEGKRDKNDVSDRDAVVLGSGNLGLVYLMEEPHRLTLEEIDTRHPELLPALRNHPARRLGDGALVRARRGHPRRFRRELSRRETASRARTPLATFSPTAGAAPASARTRSRTSPTSWSAASMTRVLDEGCAFRGADLVPRRPRRPADARLHPQPESTCRKPDKPILGGGGGA